MPKYLTTQQFRDMDTGVLTPDVADRMLTTFISNAETDIDTYMGFDLTLGGFEQHTAWMQFPWDEQTLRTRIPNSPVPMINVLRYRIQVSNISTSGSGFFATINNGDVAFNVSEGYVEIVPLQSVTYALAPVLMQLGLKPPIIQLDYTAGFYFGVTGELLINSGDNQKFYAQRGFWATSYTLALSLQPASLPPVPPVVYVNGVVQSSTTYSLNTTEGTVTFTSPQTGTVTCDYTYTIPDAVRYAAIARTTWLLGQRTLNKLGMAGVQMAGTSREQRIQRMVHTAFDGLIDPDTANKLTPYREIAIS